MSAEDVRIRGEFTADPDVCRFGINRTLLPREGSLVFRSADEGAGSPLIEALFAMEGLAQVKVHQEALVITKSDPGPWPKLAKDLLPVLKDVLGGEGPWLSDSALARLDETPDPGDMAGVIETLLEEQINPALASHGGWVKLDRLEGRDVFLILGGGCQGCSASKITLKNGIERAIRDALPQVGEVVDATDHAAGTNPYYS